MAHATSTQRAQHTLRLAGSLSARRWGALVRAGAWIAWTRAALAMRPWRSVSAAFDREPVRPGAPDWDRAKDTLWAVDAVARRVLPKRPCLTQALVARKLLRRHGVETTLQLGAARDGKAGFKAHAWLERNGEVVIGRTRTDTYVPFEPAARAPHSART